MRRASFWLMALSVVIVGSGTCLGAVSNAAGGALSESPELERPFIAYAFENELRRATRSSGVGGE